MKCFKDQVFTFIILTSMHCFADTTTVEVKICYKKSDRLEFHYFKICSKNERKNETKFSFYQGSYKEYYFDKKIRIQGFYNKNCKTGEWISYHSNGKIQSIENYDGFGRKSGKFEYYHLNGQPISKGVYFENVQVGTWAKYVFNKRTNAFEEETSNFLSIEEQKRKFYDRIKLFDNGNISYVPYPYEDMMAGVAGKAIFSFLTDSTCNLKDFKMIKSISNKTDTLCRVVAEKITMRWKESNRNCKHLWNEKTINFSLE